MANSDAMITGKKNVQCLTCGNLCAPEKVNLDSRGQNGQEINGDASTSDLDQVTEREEDLVKGVCLGKQKPINLKGHTDCISRFAIGGGFLFSSSFDKTICMWSLQDFSCVQSFRGHEHRITGIVFVESNIQLCISADIGGGIFVWRIDSDRANEPLKKWHEGKDWRYSGIQALAVSGAELLYTGSGDRSIKAWSLQDYSLVCTMNGHKSVVSCLAVCNGVLYSGSWDGTICLWSLNDHSLLTVLGEDKPGNMASVLSLSVDRDVIVAAYENGKIKMWSDKFSKSFDSQDGTTLALYIEGKWLFMGGWNKKINIQELAGDELQVETRDIGSISCDSVITALLFREGKLFAGFADRVIKVIMAVMYVLYSGGVNKGLLLYTAMFLYLYFCVKCYSIS
ncbi:hypothetical protein Sjap_021632 [Stephania japonica]|uniref:Uncharacterized protein n=1 Tax=Stephania japonica TaxID=461633 RepID=A0AAP0HUA4_9MAGN